jgi:hypothetical protein
VASLPCPWAFSTTGTKAAAAHLQRPWPANLAFLNLVPKPIMVSLARTRPGFRLLISTILPILITKRGIWDGHCESHVTARSQAGHPGKGTGRLKV